MNTTQQDAKRKRFEAWMTKVDEALERKTMLTSGDLPDCAYWDWFDDGVTPARAAERAFRSAQDY